MKNRKRKAYSSKVIKPAVWCVVSGLAAALTVGASGKQLEVGSWSVELKKDPITNAPWIIAQTSNGDAGGVWLQLRCEQIKTGKAVPLLVIGVGDNGASFKEGEAVDGVVRIDDASPLSGKFFVADAASGAFGTLMSPTTYEKLVVAHSLGYRLTRRADQWTATFTLRRTAEALKPLLSACPLSSASDDPHALGAGTEF